MGTHHSIEGRGAGNWVCNGSYLRDEASTHIPNVQVSESFQVGGPIYTWWKMSTPPPTPRGWKLQNLEPSQTLPYMSLYHVLPNEPVNINVSLSSLSHFETRAILKPKPFGFCEAFETQVGDCEKLIYIQLVGSTGDSLGWMMMSGLGEVWWDWALILWGLYELWLVSELS